MFYQVKNAKEKLIYASEKTGRKKTKAEFLHAPMMLVTESHAECGGAKKWQ